MKFPWAARAWTPAPTLVYKTKRPSLVRVSGTFVEAALPRSLLEN